MIKLSDSFIRKFKALKICLKGDGIKVLSDEKPLNCTLIRDDREINETVSAKMIEQANNWMLFQLNFSNTLAIS